MIRFIDGFDNYVTADLGKKWDAVGINFTSVPAQVVTGGRFGSNCVQTADGQFLTKVLGPVSGAVVLGFAFRLDALNGGGTNRYVARFMAGTTNQIELNIDSTGVLYMTSNGNLLTGGSATSALAVGSFVFIEIKATQSTATASGSNVVRVAGVPVITIPALANTSQGGAGVVDRFAIGSTLNANTCQYSYDDLYLLDSTGSVNNTFIGDMRVEVLHPAADGSHTDFTIAGSAPAATKWQSVNEASQDGDVTYIQSATPGAIETFTFGSLATTPTAVAAVQVNTLCRKDDAGTRIGAGVVRVSGVDYLSPTFGVADTYTLARSIFELNPATSAAWTPTEVNALEAGIKLVT